MLKKKITEQHLIDHFRKRHPEISGNPLFHSFLLDHKHRTLLTDALQHPTDKNKAALDQAFRDYYTGVRILNYLSQTLYWEAVNYDKKRRERSSTFPLVLDHPAKDEDTVVIENIESGDRVEEEVIESSHLALHERIENPNLKKGIQKLTRRQQEVLQFIYGEEKTLTETALKLGISQQAVSKIHRAAIKNLKCNFSEKEEK
ncbi:sigma-70 family RNA polymerase sigma factor [Bacillus sp. H-16]|uniref:sigma-70 family RNA polymerase sigma factor n=1 Tax=Alteribacter salitolerans TaxID=2912333 RepID=UPI001965C564|nr:sigma-70 family RNA polymerase sigma factor [Alteribacter salitolerans]MBM7095739.1 sigma-70 family RNA polymerase sigma factor [Alteribacter salitolerans]